VKDSRNKKAARSYRGSAHDNVRGAAAKVNSAMAARRIRGKASLRKKELRTYADAVGMLDAATRPVVRRAVEPPGFNVVNPHIADIRDVLAFLQRAAHIVDKTLRSARRRRVSSAQVVLIRQARVKSPSIESYFINWLKKLKLKKEVVKASGLPKRRDRKAMIKWIRDPSSTLPSEALKLTKKAQNTLFPRGMPERIRIADDMPAICGALGWVPSTDGPWFLLGADFWRRHMHSFPFPAAHAIVGAACVAWAAYKAGVASNDVNMLLTQYGTTRHGYGLARKLIRDAHARVRDEKAGLAPKPEVCSSTRKLLAVRVFAEKVKVTPAPPAAAPRVVARVAKPPRRWQRDDEEHERDEFAADW